MKLNIIFGAIVLFGILGCRKKTPLTLPNGAVEVSYTCSNGVLDGDEDGVDCGLTCTPCALSVSSCFLSENEFFVGSNTFPDVNTVFNTGEIVSSTSTGVLVLTATSGSKYVEVTFESDTPDLFRSYGVSQNPNITSEEVYIQYYSGSNLFTGYTTVVHLNKIGGKISVELCDVYMSTPSLGGYYSADGKLTEN